MRPFTVTFGGCSVGSGDFLYFGRGAVSFTAGEGKGECAHGEYSEYLDSTFQTGLLGQAEKADGSVDLVRSPGGYSTVG